MASVLMLLANPYRPDPRVQIEARALAGAGHKVTVLAWSRDSGAAEAVKDGQVDILRMGPVCPFRSIARMMTGLPRYWLAALKASRRMEFDIVHSHDFDTLPVGLLIGRLSGRPVLYDAHELYTAMVEGDIGPLSKPLQTLESMLAGMAGEVVTVNDTLASEISGWTGRRPRVVMTSPDVSPVSEGERERIRSEYGLEGFVLSYLGSLERERFVEHILEAFSPEDGVTVLIAGKGSLEGRVKEEAGRGHVRFVGSVSTDEALRLTAASDLVTAMVDPSIQHNIVGTPGKILNSMALGRPYITARGLEIATRTEKAGSGIVCRYDKDDFRRAVLSAKQDPASLKEMGRRGREHFDAHLSWARSMAELQEAYGRLLGAR
jgi:glycosyltransferase involved in cell wall biosynthesis